MNLETIESRFPIDQIWLFLADSMWSILPDANIVIDNAAILLNDDMRRFINFEFSNQYMLFLRNCDGLNVSDKSFKELKLKNNKITLAEEV